MVKTGVQRLLRALLVAVVVLSAVTTLFFAAAVCLGMIVVLVCLLAVAYAANPKAFCDTTRALRDQLDGWITQLSGLFGQFLTAVRTAVDAAQGQRNGAERTDGKDGGDPPQNPV